MKKYSNDENSIYNKKIIFIILVCIIIIILSIIMLVILSDNDTNSNKTNKANSKNSDGTTSSLVPSKPYHNKPYILLRLSDGKSATITYLDNNTCLMVFGKGFGGVSSRGNEEYASFLEYGDCTYTDRDNIITINSNSKYRDNYSYRDAFGKLQSYDIGYTYIFKEPYVLKYDPDTNSFTTISEGEWKISYGENYVCAWFEFGSVDDEDTTINSQNNSNINTYSNTTSTTTKKNYDETTHPTTIKEADTFDDWTFYLFEEEDKIKLAYSVIKSNKIKSITINGEKVSELGGEYYYDAVKGDNTYKAVIVKDNGETREVIKTYNFKSQEDIAYIFQKNCYFVINTDYKKQYNKSQNLEILYDNVSVYDSDDIRYISYSYSSPTMFYSKKGTHNLLIRNKFGDEMSKSFTFEDKCDTEKIDY